MADPMAVSDSTEQFVTGPQAAEAVRVSPVVVRMWTYRGHLVPAYRTERGRPMFRLDDVIRAERLTRQRAIRMADGIRERAMRQQ